MSSTGLIASLQQLIGAENVVADAAAAAYCRDQRGNYSGKALAVVFPSDTAQVSALTKLCASQHTAIVPQGGNTSLCGGSVPLSGVEGQLVINLSRMNRVREFDADNYTMTVEAGCTLAFIREVAEKNKRLFPLSLSAIEARCEIGGNLSTNAGGIGVLRYGNTRDMVLGLEVVLADGQIWNGLRSLRKDNSGYDLKQLFIGAEGTLGIITAAVLKLFPRALSQATACIAISSPATAVSLLAHLRATCGDRINAFEIMGRPCTELVLKNFRETREPFKKAYPWLVLTELSDVLEVPLETPLHQALGSFKDGVEDFLITADKGQASSWWNLRKHISDAQKIEGVSIKHDISVPLSNVPAFIEQADAALSQAFPGVRIVAFGHMGDGNIHYNASMPEPSQNMEFFRQSTAVNHLVYDIVARLDGSISAEHGLGQLKREEIRNYKSALELELMHRIKHSFDPHGLMNPGKVI